MYLPGKTPSAPSVITEHAPTYEEFKKEVRESYPHLSKDRRYTIHDLNQLVSRVQDYKSMSRDDLGGYYRRFLTYSQYLISRNRLSAHKQGSLCLRGFPQPVRSDILRRLSVKHPDVLPDEGYRFQDIHEAAKFALHSDGQNLTLEPEAFRPPASGKDSVEELVKAVSALTKMYAEDLQARFARPPTPGGVASEAPQWNQASSDGCIFCSGMDHYLKECKFAEEYLRKGKIARDEDTKRIVLPNGRNVSKRILGKDLKERVDRYWALEGIHGKEANAASLNFLEGIDESIFAFEVDPLDDLTSSPEDPEDDYTDREKLQLMQAQIDSLTLALQKEKKVQFDGVEVPRRTGFPPRQNDSAPAQQPSGPRVLPRNGPASSSKLPTPSATPPANGKQGTRPGDIPYPRPQGPMRPVTYPTKPSAEEAKFHYQAPIESSIKVEDITDRVLDSKVVVSARELLAMSPDVRTVVLIEILNFLWTLSTKCTFFAQDFHQAHRGDLFKPSPLGTLNTR